MQTNSLHNRRRSSEPSKKEPSHKKIKLSKMGNDETNAPLFNIESAHYQTIETIRKEEGRPFSIYIGNNIASCCAWTDLSEEIHQHLEICSKMETVFCQPVHTGQCKDTKLTCYIFNVGIKNYPIIEFIEEMYTTPTTFCSLQNESVLQKPCKHSLLSLIRLVWGISIWLENSKQHIHRIFSFGQSLQEQISILLKNLWIIDGNFIHRERREPFKIICSPIYPVDGKFVTDTVFLNEVITQISRHIFKIHTRQSKIHGCSKSVSPLFDFLHCIQSNNIISLENFQILCKNSVEWFHKNSNWPEMRWKSEDENAPWNFVPQRCVELLASDDLAINDFKRNLEITGTGIYSSINPINENEDDLFKVKPVLISVEWNKNTGLRFKIVLNQHASFRPLHVEIENIKDSNEKDVTKFIQTLHKCIGDFIPKLVHLQNQGKTFYPGNLLCKTYTRRSKFNNQKIILDISMYGCENGSDVKDDAFSYFGRKHHAPRNTEQLLNAVEAFIENPKKNNVWEFGVWLISIYQALLDHESDTSTEFIASMRPRLHLSNFPCGESFLFLISYIMTRDTFARPLFIQILNSRFMDYWLHSNDIYINYLKMADDESFDGDIHNEADEMNRIFQRANEEDTPFDYAIILKNEWSDMTAESCNNIIDAFTSSLEGPCDTIPIQRNRRHISIKFYTLEILDVGVGPGVFREAINMYCNAINKLQIFTRENKYKITNIKNEHWYVLGLLINHCVLNCYPMHLNLPYSFFKILTHGPDNVNFDMTDLMIEDPDTAKSYIDMLYMTDEEFETLDIDMEGSHPLLCGSLNSGTIHMYFMQKIRKTFLQGYNLDNLRALYRGYMLTPPERIPSPHTLWKMFSSQPEYTAKDIINMFQIDCKPSGFEHNHRCLTEKNESGDLICSDEPTRYCPLATFSQYIHNLEKEQILEFIKYTTGSTILSSMDWGALKLAIYETEQPRLPTTRTCINTFELFIHKDDTPEKLIERIHYALNNQKCSFGYE